jgi:hypothetical protein
MKVPCRANATEIKENVKGPLSALYSRWQKYCRFIDNNTFSTMVHAK